MSSFGDFLVNFALIIHVILIPLYLYLTWNWKYWHKRGVITARPLSLLGTFPSVVTRKRNVSFDIHEIYLKYKNKARAVGVFMTRKPQLLVLDPKLGSEIMVGNFKQFQETLTSSWVNNRKKDKFVSRNPFWNTGEDWKKYRSEGVPGLTQNRLKLAYPIWRSGCDKLSNYLRDKTADGSGKLSTKDLVFRFTADTMADFIWGIDGGALNLTNPDTTLMNVADKWLVHTFATFALSMTMTVAPLVRRVWQFRFNPEDTDNFFQEVTQEAMKIREKDPKQDRADFLNHLLQSKKNFNVEDATGHALVVLLDGYETTGVALSHTLFYLAKNPQAQDRLREEIRGKLAEEGSDHLSYEALLGLPFLDQCCYETARLLTLVPFFGRVCTQTTAVQVSDDRTVEIEKGTHVIVPIYSYHHDEELYPEPYKYKPERFDGGKHVECTKRGILLPFGDGPRICMGMRVGLLTIKAALVEILSKYELKCCAETPDDNELSATRFVMTLDGDIMLEYKKLN